MQAIRPKSDTRSLEELNAQSAGRADIPPVQGAPLSNSAILDQSDAIEIDEHPTHDDSQNPWPRVPRVYQQMTIDFQLERNLGQHAPDIYGSIISHAPGLGKTLATSMAATQAVQRLLDPTSEHFNPTLSIINQQTRLCTLIICPPHLMNMWYEHYDKQHPELALSLCSSDTKANRLKVLQPGFDVYIINYQALRRDDYFLACMKLPVAVLVLDESHNVKNEKAEQSKRVYKISQLATVKYRFLISATPVKKEADDLWHQLHIIDPETYRSKHFFLTAYCQADYTRYGARNVRLNKDMARKLNYVNPRTACTNPASPTFGQAFTPETYKYDWDKRDVNGRPTKITIPAVPACECCTPYEFNHVIDRVKLPDPPRPEIEKLNIKLADWLLDPKKTDAEEALESVAQFKRRKMFNITSTYDAPAPTYTETRRIAPSAVMMGFSYSDVGMYLPPVVSPTILVPMSTDARKIYQQVKETYRASISDVNTIDLNSAIAVLHGLRVLTCCDSKIDALNNLIDDAPEDEVHVVFCAYDMTAKEVAKQLQRDLPEFKNKPTHGDGAFEPYWIAGHIKPTERNEYAKSLARKRIPIVATLQSMSEGVDISYARFVHFFEEDWTPGVMYQALSRVQRTQQAAIDDPTLPQSSIETIIANYIMCEDTIDVHVHNINRDRTRNARDILRVELAK